MKRLEMKCEEMYNSRRISVLRRKNYNVILSEMF